jgi:hypothetical protein
LTLPGLEPRPLSRPARSQSLYRLRYPGSLSTRYRVFYLSSLSPQLLSATFFFSPISFSHYPILFSLTSRLICYSLPSLLSRILSTFLSSLFFSSCLFFFLVSSPLSFSSLLCSLISSLSFSVLYVNAEIYSNTGCINGLEVKQLSYAATT